MEQDHVDHIVEMWDEEWPDLDTWPLAVFGRLKVVTELIERRLAPLFAEVGINGGEFEVLSALRRAGKPYEMSPSDLSRLLIVTAGAMTKRLDNLERGGLVERSPHPSDRRALIISLTPSGSQLIDRLLPVVIADVATSLEPLAKHQKRLCDILRAVLLCLDQR